MVLEKGVVGLGGVAEMRRGIVIVK